MEKLKAHEIDSLLERVTTLRNELGHSPPATAIKDAIAEGFGRAFSIDWVPSGLTPWEGERLARLLPEFRSGTWIDRRAPGTQRREALRAVHRGPGGVIRLLLEVDLGRSRIRSAFLTGDFFSFILLGSLLGAYISAVFWGIGYSLKMEMDSGVLESNWMTPVPRLAFLVGRTLTSLVVTTLNCTGVLLASWLLFGFSAGGPVGKAMLITLPMLAGLYGFGFAFAGLVLLMRDANTLVDVSSFLVGELSGRGFPVTVLPRALMVISLVLPTTYGFDAVRALLLGTKPLLPLGVAAVVLVGFMVAMLVLGGMAFSAIERVCRARGTLGMH